METYLIFDENIDGMRIRIYNEIDLETLNSHPKDGSEGFIFCFVQKNFNLHVNRAKNLDVLMDVNKEDDYYDISKLDNMYLALYCTFYDDRAKVEFVKQLVEKRGWDSVIY